jgi:hypothetical protein
MSFHGNAIYRNAADELERRKAADNPEYRPPDAPRSAFNNARF